MPEITDPRLLQKLNSKPAPAAPASSGPMGAQPFMTSGPDPRAPLEIRGKELDNAGKERQAQIDALIIQGKQLDNERARIDAQNKAAEEKKIGELRQRDANLRSLADQIVVTEDAYNRNYRGGWPNFIAGRIPSSSLDEFNTLAGTLVDVGQSAFRVPGSGDQSDQELRLKLEAIKPSASKSDKGNDANFDYLRNRVNTERQALGLAPIDWQTLATKAEVKLPSFDTPTNRGVATVSGDGSNSKPSQRMEQYTQEVQDAFNRGATREQIDAIAAKYGAPSFGKDLDDALAIRAKGGRASFTVPNDIESGPQDILGMRPDGAFGAFATAAGNQVAGGRLDEMSGAMNGPDAARAAQMGKDYLREKHPVASILGDIAGIYPMALTGAAMGFKAGLSAPRAILASDIATGAYTGSGENNENPFLGSVIGGAAGFAGNKIGTGVAGMFGRAISPTGGAMTSAYEQGVRPTIGQRFADKGIVGKAINTAEQALQSVPFVGAIPANARQAARDQWERGAFDRALSPLNDRLPQGMEAGNDAFAYTRKAFDDAYDRARSGMQFIPDGPFASDFGTWQRGVTGSGLLDGESIKQVEKAITNTVGSRMRGGALTGDTYKKAVSDLGKTISQTSKPEVKTALSDFRSILDAAARRNSNPDAVSLMDAADLGYSQFKPLKDAARMAGSEPGRFTPAGLASVERRTMGKTNAYLEGNTRMTDYLSAGQNLRDTLPNSGTGERLMTGQLAVGAPMMGGAAWLDPTGVLPAGIAAGTLPYAPVVRDVVSKAMAPRESPILKQIGDTIYNQRRLGGMFGAPLAITYANQQ